MQDSTLAVSQAVPAPVAQAAASSGLGALLKIYAPKRQNWFLLVFLVLLGLATTFILVGFWLLWAAWRSPNLSGSQAAKRIYLFQQGIVIADKPEDPQVYRWDAITTVYQQIVSRRVNGIYVGTTYLYTITRRDGKTVKLTHFWADIAELGPHINQCVSQVLMPGTLAAIEHGQGVQFGDLTLSAIGVAGPRRQVTWPEVSNVSVSRGYVRVGVAGKFLSLSTTAAAKIPNLPLFLTLAERLRANAQR